MLKLIKWAIILFVTSMVVVIMIPKDKVKIAECHTTYGEEQCDIFGDRYSESRIAKNKAEAEAQKVEETHKATLAQAKYAADNRKIAEDNRKGFHCLSGWDGSHREVAESRAGR